MELYVWNGESKWGLPSMDLKSLQLILYVKFSQAPVTITKCSHPYSAPKRTLPAFKCSAGILTDFHTVTSYLRHEGHNCDYSLSPTQCADVRAYESLLEEKLMPALAYLWWVEPSNYHNVIHKWYYENTSFPFKLWLPGSYHARNVRLISALVEEDDCESNGIVETTILKNAQECLTNIAYKMGDREYFFGDKPSVIDAILIPYLALLLKVDLKMAVLQNYIKACPNLSRPVNKTLQSYFPQIQKQQEKRKRESKPTEAPPPDSDENPNMGRNILVSGLVATTAMVGYAIASGLVQVDMGADSMDDNSYLDEDFSDD